MPTSFPKKKESKTQAISNTVYALAKLEHKDEKLIAAL